MFLASSDMKKDKIHMIALMLFMNLFKLNAFGIFVIKVMNPTTNTMLATLQSVNSLN